MRRWGAFGTVATATVGAACSLVVDTAGLTGSHGAASDGGAVDSAAADAPAGDASGSDALASDAAPPGTTCNAAGALACDDFDQGALGASWSGIDLFNGASVGLDSTLARSGPNALLVSATTNTNGARYARLRKTVAAVPSGVRCQLYVNLESTTATAAEDVNILRLSYGTPSGLRTLDVQMTSSDVGTQERGVGSDGGAVDNSGPSFSIPRRTWVKITLTTNFRSVSLAKDDGAASTGSLDPATPSSLEIAVGLCQDTEAPAWKYRIDDVRCDPQ